MARLDPRRHHFGPPHVDDGVRAWRGQVRAAAALIVATGVCGAEAPAAPGPPSAGSAPLRRPRRRSPVPAPRISRLRVSVRDAPIVDHRVAVAP
ncbi:MAG: hypothetical protein LC790_09420 [Actinobacteria bacterium]|nr:hypothetical protein [Actinomycetota bacterium]